MKQAMQHRWLLLLFLPGLVAAVQPERGRTYRTDETGQVSLVDALLPAVAAANKPALVHAPAAALPVAALIVGTVVVLIYGNRGGPVVASVLVYLAALSSITLSVKWVLDTNSFEYPKFISVCHFLVGAMVTGSALLYRKHKSQPVPTPTVSEFFTFILPIALAVVCSIGANNTALVFNSAAFTEIMGSTNSLMTMGLVTILGMPPGVGVIPPAMLVAAGCIVSTAGEVHFSNTGVALCLTATFFRSLKVAFQQRLLVGDTKDKLDPVALLFWISLPSLVVMWLFSLVTEGMAPYKQLASTEGAKFTSLMVALGVSCVNATILNVAQLFVTKDLGAVGSQLAAQTKMVLVVLGGMVLFQEAVTRTELFGFVLVLLGVFWFSRVEAQDAKDNEKKGLLPAGKLSMLTKAV